MLAPPLTVLHNTRTAASQPHLLPPPPLQADQLLSLTPPARGLLQAGRVFAVQDVEGGARRARLSLEDGRLHLYSLHHQDQDSIVTLQVRR